MIRIGYVVDVESIAKVSGSHGDGDGNGKAQKGDEERKQSCLGVGVNVLS